MSDTIKKYFLVNKGKEFGIASSGGMDSGATIGLLHKESEKRVKAISMTYNEDTPFDETDLLTITASAAGDLVATVSYDLMKDA